MLDASNVHQLKEIVVVCEAAAQARRLISSWTGRVRLYAIFDKLQEEIRAYEADRRQQKAETSSTARDADEDQDRAEGSSRLVVGPLPRKESEVRPVEQTAEIPSTALSIGNHGGESKRHGREVVVLIGRARRALKAIGGGSSSSKRD